MKRYTPGLFKTKKLEVFMIEDEEGEFIKYEDHLQILSDNEILMNMMTSSPKHVEKMIEEIRI